MLKSNQYKIYLSDEGFGPLIREKEIIKSLNTKDKNLTPVIQTERHFNDINWIIGKDIKKIKKNNLIEWSKNLDGSPNLKNIEKFFLNYQKNSKKFFKEETKDKNLKFIISDFSPDAFNIAKKLNIPSYGVAHFSWDWFFSKLYFKNNHNTHIRNSVLSFWEKAIHNATKIFCPPFTPIEVLEKYEKKIIQTPFVVKKILKNNRYETDIIANMIRKIDRKYKVLIIDSGSKVLFYELKKILKETSKVIDDYQFFVPQAFKKLKSDNISILPNNSIFSDYIPYVDVVIGRAGFNTISECMYHKTPIILISENGNPETKENIFNLVVNNLGHYYNIKEDKLHKFLPKYFSQTHSFYKEILLNKKFKFNGAEFIANNIIKSL
tara:strand:- start:593 stop:1729 length:1137 start_codon:yes stop_codon:yes gene_type:complete